MENTQNVDDTDNNAEDEIPPVDTDNNAEDEILPEDSVSQARSKSVWLQKRQLLRLRPRP